MTNRTTRFVVYILALGLVSPALAEGRRGKRKGKGLEGVLSSLGNGAAQPVRTVMVPMRDGVKLATDLVLPLGDRKRPVVLMRTPYGRKAGAGLSQIGGVAASARRMIGG